VSEGADSGWYSMLACMYAVAMELTSSTEEARSRGRVEVSAAASVTINTAEKTFKTRLPELAQLKYNTRASEVVRSITLSEMAGSRRCRRVA
jgi:hypothetical protein